MASEKEMQGLANFRRRLFGTVSDKALESVRPLVDRINHLEAEFLRLPDVGLQERTQVLKGRALGGEPLDQLLPEAFANCREALRRSLGLRAFDVQLAGGVVLHQGKIAEMATGEGKTLVAVLAAYLNSLTGKGVHVATVNEYLAKRDAEWMGKTYVALGVTSSRVYSGQLTPRKRLAYRADITYSIYSELAFDYLNDNMRSNIEDVVQRGHSYAIIDEADSVLIDEALTPLVISGPSQDRSELYIKVNEIVSRVLPEHFDQNREHRSVTLTEEGNEFVEKELKAAKLFPEDQSFYEGGNQTIILHFMQALRAHKIYRRDQQYIVLDQEVVLINSSTGRMMPKRRLSDGLHQAIEAKEGLTTQAEAITLASTIVQNYFDLYPKLSGLTGTAVTDSDEFRAVYNLDVVELPTSAPVLRHDQEDKIYRTENEKHLSIMEVVWDTHRRGQPILVGTTSIEKSGRLSEMLHDKGIEHNVLNAHHHGRESQIIADAGRLRAVTIASNMAGRGTDIQLGGNLQFRLQRAIAADPDLPLAVIRTRIENEHRQEKSAVMAAGGLLVLGTERHDSRRIDNQLRGRSGRQGDPGRTLFILSLEDELMKNVEVDWLGKILSHKKLEESETITQRYFKKALDSAQSRAESRNFQIRKQLLRFDNVVNEQRKAIYAQRLDFMRSFNVSDIVGALRRQFADDLVAAYLPANTYAELWDAEGLETACRDLLMLDLPIVAWAKEEAIKTTEICSRILDAANSTMKKKAELLGPELMRNLEKQILLQAVDSKWYEHRVHLEQVRSIIGLRSYARRDPLHEFQTEALDQFEKLLVTIRGEVSSRMAQIRPMTQDEQFSMMGRFAMQNSNYSKRSDQK